MSAEIMTTDGNHHIFPLKLTGFTLVIM